MLVIYVCEVCEGEAYKFYRSHKDVKDEIDCKCKKGVMGRVLSSPSTKITQVIDNGAMSRKVELSNDVIQKETDKLKNQGDI